MSVLFRLPQNWGQGGILLGLLLLTGCGEDRPSSGPPPAPPRQAAAAPSPITEPLKPSDTPDPLLGKEDADQTAPDPLLGSDPLQGRADPLQGRAMPTRHSHWLRGNLRDAHVMVLLNGVRLASFSGVVDQDITMKLHQGINQVTFVYQPGNAGSTADLEIVEGEHHPPLAPLVTFHATGLQVGSKQVPVTHTFMAD